MKTIQIPDLVSMDAPSDGWHHIESNEEHPNDKVGVVQVLDNEAMRAIVEAGVPDEGLIVDVDHRSLPTRGDAQDTAAAGWVRELAAFDDGAGNLQLAGRIEWTPLGLELVQGKVYKHFSSVYNIDSEHAEDLGNGRVRPLALLGLALTNTPNNWRGQRPITNSSGAAVGGSTNDEVRMTNEKRGASGADDNFPHPHGADEDTHKEPNTTMNDIDTIKEALGLTPEATVEDVLAAINALKQSEAEAADSAAEALLNSEGLADLPEEEKKELKEGLATNSGLTMIAIRALKAKRGQAGNTPAPDYTKGGMTRPRALGSTGGKDATLLINTARDIQKSERAAGRTCSFWRAKNMAKQQLRKEGK